MDYYCNFILSKRSKYLDGFHSIEQKLEHFIRRYYINALLKGVLLFFSIGLLYALSMLSIEHFFWLSSVLEIKTSLIC